MNLRGKVDDISLFASVFGLVLYIDSGLLYSIALSIVIAFPSIAVATVVALRGGSDE